MTLTHFSNIVPSKHLNTEARDWQNKVQATGQGPSCKPPSVLPKTHASKKRRLNRNGPLGRA